MLIYTYYSTLDIHENGLLIKTSELWMKFLMPDKSVRRLKLVEDDFII